MAEPRYKVVNGEYIELTAEELAEMADRAAAADLDFSMVRMDRNNIQRRIHWRFFNQLWRIIFRSFSSSCR